MEAISDASFTTDVPMACCTPCFEPDLFCQRRLAPCVASAIAPVSPPGGRGKKLEIEIVSRTKLCYCRWACWRDC
eukprot:6870360-Lingulodinium_polyedra.AAC.1